LINPNAADRPEPSLLGMAWPLVISFVMRAAFTLVDTAFAASIGDAAVAAVGLTLPFEFLMIAAWAGLSTGLTSCLGRALGAGGGASMRGYLRAARQLVSWVGALFVGLGAAIWWWAPNVGLEPEVAAAFRVYGCVLVGGSGFTLFWSVLPDSVVKAHQDTRSTMWAGIWSNTINVGLNTLFTFVFRWGVFGIALSTVLGRFGGLWYASRKAGQHEARRRAASGGDAGIDDPRPIAAILVLAVPSTATLALSAGEAAVVNALLASGPDSTASIAAYSIHARVVLFALNPILAIGVAMLPFAARRYGKGDLAGVRRGLRDAVVAASAYVALVCTPAVLLVAPVVAAWLAESPRTEALAVVALRLTPVACLAAAPFFLCRPLFEAMGRGEPGLSVAALRFGVLTAPAVWLGIRAADAGGLPALYGALAGALVATSLTSAGLLAWAHAATRGGATAAVSATRR
jgi:Na+-driven multidrug efflux pump